jgi:NAD(P)-dependent dehydrogenase (short-subunit alcohol dehydrogenase family)
VADENDPVEDLTRVAVVTGASSGIGLAAAESLAAGGDHVVLVGRDPGRLDAAVDRVRRTARAEPAAMRADFAVLDEVRALADRLRRTYPRIDVLANNAGALLGRRATTVDGHELSMQTNHLAPFLLANLLRDRISRTVSTASRMHQLGRLDPDDLSSPGRYVPMLVYATTKQANVLFAAEAARRWPDVLSTSYSPGTVRTRFGSDSALLAWYFRAAPWLRTPARGADTLVWLATAPAEDLVNGGYHADRRLRRPARRSTNPVLAARLWDASLAAVGLA